MHFQDFASAHGLILKGLHAKDAIQRCGTEDHPRSDNGAFLWDGHRGWVMRWDGDGQVHWFEGEKREPTEQEKRAWAEQRQRARMAKERGFAQASRDAAEMIKTSTLQQHGYLKLKGFPEAKGFVTKDDCLLVPMRDLQTNALRGIQRIAWIAEDRKWRKKMLHGMRAELAVLRLGPRSAPVTILAEGYATALSIEAAMALTKRWAIVMCCFSDSNMVKVAQGLKGRVVVCADNDESGAGERAAKATGFPYCMSQEVGEDMNDVHYRSGLWAVAKMLNEVL